MVRLLTLLFLLFIPLTASAKENSKRPKVESVPGQYVIELNENLFPTKALERRLDAKIIQHIRPQMILVERAKREPTDHALTHFKTLSFVKSASPNFIYRANGIPNDPEFSKLWGMSNSGAVDSAGNLGVAGVDIGAEKAWEISTGSKDVIVAVLDTGVDFAIPDLADNAWVNEKERDGEAGVDDDMNGYVDDINGYDFSNEDGNPVDDFGHGSHCAGTLGARGNDGVGVAGVSWNVRIMAVKFLDARGSGTLANAVRALDYARINGAHILNNSWGGGGYNSPLEEAIKATRDAGQLFVSAAGNDGGDNDVETAYPSGYDVDNIIAVAAIDNRGELGHFSNFGKTKVDIAAPGVNIYSTIPSGFGTESGTSMAAPHVAGVAALLLAQNPELTYQQLIEKLLSSAKKMHVLKNKVASNGMLDAYYALSGETPPADPNDPERFPGYRDEAISTAHPYENNAAQAFTITVPGAKRVSAFFTKFETESSFDFAEFYDGAGNLVGKWSGAHDEAYSPIANGDTLVIKFTSDGTYAMYGFDINHVKFEE